MFELNQLYSFKKFIRLRFVLLDLKKQKSMKKNHILFLTCLLIIFTGCEKMDISKSTEIIFQINDETGKLSKCNLRIIKPNPDNWENVYSHMITLPGESSYKFEDVKEGDYASLIGNVSETYKNFSISKGDHLKITYTYYVSGYVNVGGHTVPYKEWKCKMDRD